MAQQLTSLAKLLQDRREAAGYSRRAIGDILDIKPGTIEGWELGRVRKPPIHDVLRMSCFLRIPADELERAVIEDTGIVQRVDDLPPRRARKQRSRPTRSASQLLEAAFLLLEWADDNQAAEALGVTTEDIRGWRTGARLMELPDYVGLSSIIGLAAAEAMRGDTRRAAAAVSAARVLGLRSGAYRVDEKHDALA